MSPGWRKHWFINYTLASNFFFSSLTKQRGKTINCPCFMLQGAVSQIISNPIWQLRQGHGIPSSLSQSKRKQKQIRGLILAVRWTPTVAITCCWTNSLQNTFTAGQRLVLPCPLHTAICPFVKTVGKVLAAEHGQEEGIIAVTVYKYRLWPSSREDHTLEASFPLSGRNLKVRYSVITQKLQRPLKLIF